MKNQLNVTFSPTPRFGSLTRLAARGTLFAGLSRGLARTAALVCLCAAGAGAQTAHFSGAINTLGSGFSLPFGVAVDGSGNVFVTDNCNNAVKEIVAAGGYTTVNTRGSGRPRERRRRRLPLRRRGGGGGGARLRRRQHPGQRIQLSRRRGGGRERERLRQRLLQQGREGDCGGGRLHHGQHPGQRIPPA